MTALENKNLQLSCSRSLKPVKLWDCKEWCGAFIFCCFPCFPCECCRGTLFEVRVTEKTGSRREMSRIFTTGSICDGYRGKDCSRFCCGDQVDARWWNLLAKIIQTDVENALFFDRAKFILESDASGIEALRFKWETSFGNVETFLSQ